VLPYVHPIAAVLGVAFLGYVGSLGLRARSDRRHAHQHLARHARLAPVMYWLLVATWVAGCLSTWLLRPDLELGASVHFRIGTAMVAVLSGGALTSRWMRRPEIRALHPWLGAAAMLLAAAQIFFGLQITP
jgi:threonine/homoserine/homoserine lactone efflux protein